MDNDEIVEKNANEGKLAPDDEYSREVLLIMLHIARAEGYKEGQQAERQKCIAILKDLETDLKAIAKLSEKVD